MREDEFVLVDPQAPTDEEDRETFWDAVDRDVEHHGAPHVVLTVAWHRRSTDEVVSRYEGTRVWAYRGETEGGPATDALRPGHGAARRAARVRRPLGARGGALVGRAPRAADGGRAPGRGPGGLRLLPDSWVPKDMTRVDVAAALAPLLDLPVELVLPAHGDPVLADGAAALERALRS